MQRQDHALLCSSLGSNKTLSSFHFGQTGARPKVYIQANLHADELPGMLVAHHLRALLEAAEAAGEIRGEIILLPTANPIGLAQRLDHKPMGRFELGTSENFNRHYPNLAKEVAPTVLAQLGNDGATNVTLVRAAVSRYLRDWVPSTELQSLRRQLLVLAHDADYVLDLHCDCEGVLHLYTEEPCWSALEPLSRLLACQTVLLAKTSGGGPFDECLSNLWSQLATLAPERALPQACHSTTVELRGEADVSHAWARADAQAIFQFLQHCEALHTTQAPTLPPPQCSPTPLGGSETLRAKGPGVLVFAIKPGAALQVGDLVAEVIDPIANQTQRVQAGVAGLFYAHIRDRYVTAGAEIGKIAGAIAFKTGDLLGE